MVYVCSTKKGNVIFNINLMKKDKRKMPLVQFGIKKHDELEKMNNEGNSQPIYDAVVKRIKNLKYKVNITALSVHTKDCKRAGKNTVKAHFINLPSTGLRACKHCIK